VYTTEFRERLLKCASAIDLHDKVLWQRHRLHELAEKLGTVLLLFNEHKNNLARYAGAVSAFIDPFGWTGAPFSVVQSILRQPNCEVLVTFMYEEINRFIGLPDQEANFDIFFGTREWRSGINPAKPAERNRFLHDLYLRQLKEAAGANYVRSFQMRNAAGLTDYYLFYATNNLLGLKKMKEAMWKVDESGEFTFSDATDPNQLVLFSKSPRFDDLEKRITARFAGQEASVGEIEEFVLAETAYRETHYKRQVLKELEGTNPPRITIVNAPSNRRRGTFGDPSMSIRFLQ
jgi:hypothetical protein